jgi:hypothetical protein
MASRTFRLFISSTFSDMAHERRILHDEVFPQLTQLCTSRGAQFQAVDLLGGQRGLPTRPQDDGHLPRRDRALPATLSQLRAEANAKQAELLDS